MLRSIIGIAIGVLVASIVVIFAASAVHQNFFDPDANGIGIGEQLGVIGAWAASTFLGGFITALIGGRWAPAVWVLAATMVLFAVTNIGVSSGAWSIAIGALPAIAGGGWLAIFATRAKYGPPPIKPKKGGIL
ncbi:MAG: hypothetical protein R3C60_09080 [Parvularculaceae bacterium]